ncbi:MAG: hypothetical protein HRT47_12550 [Candidatus Caenarcaniphilales bacterium]|nr:hypothetical protein [Candidatus Caenarcaniphilales bacterium]
MNQILASYYQQGIEPNLWLYRNQTGHEIDFLIDEGLKLTAIEAKFAERPNLDKVKKNFDALKRHYGDESISKLIIKSTIKEEFKISKEINISPGWIY